MTKIERKRHGPRGAQTAWFYQYLAKGLHKEKNRKRMDRNRAHNERKRTYCAIVAQYENRMVSNRTRL